MTTQSVHMSGDVPTEVMEFICGAAFERVERAVTALRERVPTKRARFEDAFQSMGSFQRVKPSRTTARPLRHGVACTQACRWRLLVTSLTE